jgi:hypothetical protein
MATYKQKWLLQKSCKRKQPTKTINEVYPDMAYRGRSEKHNYLLSAYLKQCLHGVQNHCPSTEQTSPEYILAELRKTETRMLYYL